ncbi:elongation factor Ts [Metamycoplasma subdolum]|uniref:Elongation factor Ts n=1 Tax=Metamycoplasma subdolum TaxID=92407 RepID=A0A3M0A1F7_9BACT|nr:translation elongation factor Ts [Metamycoplasma subdolum]RMA78991.1 elongation factor Ts [Metamycoplasma subdolum]WPB50514.1 translation elongation factor Ts [Metamycoplasma subdolum]
MAVDLNKVKELRERTNSGFLDCKNALEATKNDVEAAIKWLQEKGIIKAAKKAGRIAAEGVTKAYVDGKVAVIFELNSETDFVAKNKLFQEFANKVQVTLAKEKWSTIEDAKKLKIDGKTIEEGTNELTAKIGEKIALRRAEKYVAKANEILAGYTHFGDRIAVIVKAEGKNEELARQIAMHVSALNPSYLCEECLPKDVAQKVDKTVSSNKALVGKPEKIQASMKAGLFRKEYNELGVLLYQPFVIDDSKIVKVVLENANMKLLDYVRFEVGEGIEKKSVDFATEVAEQMKK